MTNTSDKIRATIYVRVSRGDSIVYLSSIRKIASAH